MSWKVNYRLSPAASFVLLAGERGRKSVKVDNKKRGILVVSSHTGLPKLIHVPTSTSFNRGWDGSWGQSSGARPFRHKYRKVEEEIKRSVGTE